MVSQNVCVIYHKGCIDGTMAAGLVLRAFPQALTFPLRHAYTEAEFAPIRAAVTADTHVYIVDCVLGLSELLALGCAITVIDHHAEACEHVAPLIAEHPQATLVADPSHSGASLAWRTLFPAEPVPGIIEHVEDGDLWLGKYADTGYVSHYLSIFRDDPASMLAVLEVSMEVILEKGGAIARFVEKEIEGFVQAPPCTLRINGHEVPAYNITTHESLCGNLLAKRHERAVVLFAIRGGEVKCSVRSLPHHTPNALAIASALGGGGHPCASGATVPLGRFWEIFSEAPGNYGEAREKTH